MTDISEGKVPKEKEPTLVLLQGLLTLGYNSTHQVSPVCPLPFPLPAISSNLGRTKRYTVSGRGKVQKPSREIVKMRVDHAPSPLLVCGWKQREAGETKVVIFIVQDLLILCLKIQPFNIWKGVQNYVICLRSEPGPEKGDPIEGVSEDPSGRKMKVLPVCTPWVRRSLEACYIWDLERNWKK